MVKYVAIDAANLCITIEEIDDESLKVLSPNGTTEDALESYIYDHHSSSTEWMVLDKHSVLRLKGDIKIVTL